MGPIGVRSTARVESTAVKVGKVSRVAEALPHGEGIASKPPGGEVAMCPRETGGWGRSKRRGTETTELGPEPTTPLGQKGGAFEQRHAEVLAIADSEPRKEVPVAEGCEGRRQTGGRAADAGSELERGGLREGPT